MEQRDKTTQANKDESAHARQEDTSLSRGIQRRQLLKTAGLAAGAWFMTDSIIARAEERLIPPLDGKSEPDYNPGSEYLFSIIATIGDAMSVGETAQGQVRAIPITGGEVEGDNIKGRVVPGGMDWQLSRIDGVTEVEATYAIQLEDKTFIKVVNRGLLAPSENESYFRTQIHFDAPKGPHEWLNESIFLCKAGLHPERERTVLVEVFKLV